MGDYVRVHNYVAKDQLPTGNVAKIIEGSDWDDEFAAISTAIASKYDNTDTIPIADGGTGATTAADARTNLGLGAAAVLDRDINNSILRAEESATSTTQPSLASMTLTAGDYIIGSFNIELDPFPTNAGDQAFTIRKASGTSVCSPLRGIPGTGNTIPWRAFKPGSGGISTWFPQTFLWAFKCTTGGTAVFDLLPGADTGNVTEAITDLQLRGIAFKGA